MSTVRHVSSTARQGVAALVAALQNAGRYHAITRLVRTQENDKPNASSLTA